MTEQKDYVSELKNNRIRNTGRTATFSFIYVAIASVGPFLVRTIMIYMLGEKYAGLNDLFISIISILNMAEMGLSNVITFFLFEPLAKGDKAQTEHYLSVMRRIYRFIGCAILTVGLIITPFLPMLTNDIIPKDAHIYLSFVLFLVASCIQYFVIPEVAVLANAAQKGYLVSMAGMTGCIIVYVLQVIAIVSFRSFVMYYVAVFVQTIVVIVINRHVSKRYFSDYHPQGDIKQEEKQELRKKILSLLGHQMDARFISSIDRIVVSTVLGLTMVTRYCNYMLVITSVTQLFSSVFSSLTASLGNACVTETRETNYIRFKSVLWLNGVMDAWGVACMFCTYQVFMSIWMKNRVFPIDTVILFCIYFFVTQIRSTVLVFKNAIGMWWEDRYKPYVSMLINLALDIILVNTIGVNGALFSSIFCIVLIEIPWEAKVLHREYFAENVRKYFVRIGGYALFAFLVTLGSALLCAWVVPETGIVALLVRGMITTLVFVVGTVLVFWRSEELAIWKKSFRFLLKGNKDKAGSS